MELTHQKVLRKKRKVKLGMQDESKEVNAVVRLSDLPDALLEKIISQLYLRQAVQTSILSRRFRFLWMYLDNLNFSMYSSEFVDKFLLLHKGPKISVFSVHEHYANDDSSRKDSWVEFALSRKVQKLELRFNSGGYPPTLYKLPKCFFICDSLIHLKLKCCKFILSTSTRLIALKSCFIEESELGKNEIMDFTSGCPVLRKLTLHLCNTSSPLNVVLRNANLVELVIYDLPSKDNELEIDGPYLLSLTIKSHHLRDKYTLENLSSLTRVALDLEEMADPYSLDGEWGNLLYVFSRLAHAKQLYLCRGCLQILSHYNCKYNFRPFIKSQSLEIDTLLLKYEVLGLAFLLQWFLNLENLSLNLQWGYMQYLCQELRVLSPAQTKRYLSDGNHYPSTRSFGDLYEHEAAGHIGREESLEVDEEDLWVSIGIVCATKLHSLKRVKISGFSYMNIPKTDYENVKERALRCRTRQVKLVKELLENLVALDSITIEAYGKGNHLSESSRIGKKLLSFARASQDAQVVLL